MLSALSAVGAISPAFEQTRRQLFQPFRLGLWVRLGVVSLVTGEFAGGGWGGMGANVSPPRDRREVGLELLWQAGPVWERIQAFLPWILAGLAALLILGLLAIYIASVFRFILLEAVLHDRCELREGWRRWQPHGSSYFLWLMGLSLAMLLGMVVLVGVPAFLAWRAGVFRQPNQHVFLLAGGGAALFFVLLAFGLLGTLAFFFAKDFVVPVMALENLGVMDAWSRLLPMLGAEKAAYAGYVLMKIVLSVGCAVLFAIVNLFVLLGLLIPLGIVGVFLFLAAKAAGLAWNLYTVGAAVLLASAGVSAVLYAIAFVSAPAMVFFQSYTLHFFGSRYPALGALMAPIPPAPPPAASAPAS